MKKTNAGEVLGALGLAAGLAGLGLGMYSLFSSKKTAVASVGGGKTDILKHVVMSDEVREALLAHKPVVALESTIITHGMKHPENVEMAMKVEQVIRDNGATPATIAIIKGQMCIGLSEENLVGLATTGKQAEKISIRDIGRCISRELTGGTTVAATMYIASLVGIRVFATGGIGGVHFGAGQSFDVSCDLQTFSRVPVAVVCAGPKAILDIPATAEYLETLGVPIVGYKTEYMPCFYSSKFEPELALDDVGKDAEDIARQFKAMNESTPSLGMLIVNPIKEEDEIPFEEMRPQIETALKDAERMGVTGKGITPLLLERLVELTDGKSLETNIKLVLNNARVAAKLAVKLSQL